MKDVVKMKGKFLYFFLVFMATIPVVSFCFEEDSKADLPRKSSIQTYPELREVVPVTTKELQQVLSSSKETMQKQMDLFLDEAQKENFPKALEHWNEIYMKMISSKVKFTFAEKMGPENEAKQALKVLYQFFEELIQNNPQVLRAYLKMAQNEALSSYQAYIAYHVLQNYLKEQKTEAILLALDTLKKKEQKPYATFTKKGELHPLRKDLKVVNWNVLFFQDLLTVYFGGVLPWSTRIDRVILKLIDFDADLVCLQEVWDPKAATYLIKGLKAHYDYFYYDIGSQAFIFNPEELSFNSGLFVASKYPVYETHFYPFPFPNQAKGLHRGLFLTVLGKDKPEFSVINSHFESGEETRAQDIRKMSLTFAYDKLEGSIPSFLTGDLNIAFGEKQQDSGMDSYFDNAYTKKGMATNEKTATATNYFDQLLHTKRSERKNIVPIFEILDYFLIKKGSISPKQIKTEKIRVFDLQTPFNSLSDHNPLISQYQPG